MILKLLFLSLGILFSFQALGQSPSSEDKDQRSALTLRLAEYKITASENNRKMVFSDLDLMGDMTLNENQDLEMVKNALVVLVKVDSFDHSRQGLESILESYSRHKKIYKKAAKAIETPQNKAQLVDFFKILDNPMKH